GAEESKGGKCDGDRLASRHAARTGRDGPALQADHGGEDEEKRQQRRENGHADQDVVGSAHRGAGLAERGDKNSRRSQCGDGYPWSSIARVYPAKRGWKIVMDADDKGKARIRGEIGRRSANRVEPNQQRYGDEQPAESEMSAELADSADKAVRAADGLGRQRNHQRSSSADVADGEDAAADEDCPGNCAPGILNFVAHGGTGLNAGVGQADSGPEHGVADRPVGNQTGRGKAGSGTESPPRDC